ncbi:hypothetical protein [Flavobacterium sp.]|jgi:hypothetical protein|uniref:hypothetical protein n=1 Tax=Flavobacterium sp. TaxID=239 RepID=UPI0037C08825
MKITRLLRILSLFGFLLLMAPFYDSCNGERMHRIADANAEATVDSTAVKIDSTLIDSTEICNTEVDIINNSVENFEPSFAEKMYDVIDDDNSENAFEFAKISIDNILEFDYKAFKKDTKKEKDLYKVFFFHLKNFCFVLICIITFLIFIFSFKDSKWRNKLSRLNLILILITVICLFFEGLFETITQIKWGYYAFIITNLLIFYYSRKALNRQNS